MQKHKCNPGVQSLYLRLRVMQDHVGRVLADANSESPPDSVVLKIKFDYSVVVPVSSSSPLSPIVRTM